MGFVSFYPWSPLKAVFVHGVLALSCCGAILACGAAYIHYTGDEGAASPVMRLALFDDRSAEAVKLKLRLQGSTYRTGHDTVFHTGGGKADSSLKPPASSGDEPDLKVEYMQPAAPGLTKPVVARQPQGIRINGQTVLPGQSLRQVRKGNDEPVIRYISPTVTRDGFVEEPEAGASDAMSVVLVGSNGSGGLPTSLERHAHPFENPDGKPTVSIIVGGLGVNDRWTQMAIEQLPPEVTLSFTPLTVNLSEWIGRARDAGHEVLIEVPMESYANGTRGPNSRVMQMAADTLNNKRRLDDLLSPLDGYIGLINYQGDKFVSDPAAINVFMTDVSGRGLAFFEDGSLPNAPFSGIARGAGLPFAGADIRIETGSETDAFRMLETRAVQDGHVLGTVTVFAGALHQWRDWISGLGKKGILLAPASYAVKHTQPSGYIGQVTINKTDDSSKTR